MNGRQGNVGKIKLGMLKGKSITTSVPSFAIRFHAEDEELEEIFPSEETDDDAEKEEELDNVSMLSTAAVSSAVTANSATTSSTAANAAVGNTTVTASSSRDPSPMKEYLKGLGKRSTSVDVGVLDASPGTSSDTWRIFHELKGKITKTVEEKLSEMKSDRKSGSLSFSDIGRGSKLIAKSKDNSSISDSEDISEASSKASEQKDSCQKVEPSQKKTLGEMLSKKNSSSVEEKDTEVADHKCEILKDVFPEDGCSTPVVCEIDSVPEIMTPKKFSFHSRFKTNISGLRHRHSLSPDKPKLISSVTMSSLSSTKDDERADVPIETEVESGVEASEDVTLPAQETIIDPEIMTIDYRTSVPSTHPKRENNRRDVPYNYMLIRKLTPWRYYIALLFAVICCYYIPVPSFVWGVVCGMTSMYLFLYASELYKHLFISDEALVSGSNASTIGSSVHSSIPILSIPAAKEYQPLTKYAGWLNEYSGVYDPNTYHIIDTHTVYVRLEGSTLRISHPRARIPKHAMWNERRHRLRFSHQRIYSIVGCEIKLLPDGLIRKRLWSKKYPICIMFQKPATGVENHPKEETEEEEIYKNTDQLSDPEADSVSEMSECGVAGTSYDTHHIEAEDEEELSGHDEMSEDDTFCHIEKSSAEHNCLYFFARTDREKEDWFRWFSEAAVCTSSPVSSDEKPLSLSSSPIPPPPPPPTPKVGINQHPSSVEVTTELFNEAVSSAIISEDKQTHASLLARLLDQSEYLDFMLQFDLRSNTCIQQASTPLKSEDKTEPDAEQDRMKDLEQEGTSLNNVMWFNAFIGRVLYDVLNSKYWILKIQERLQKKLSTIKLPYFMEDILISELDLGETVPLIQRVSSPIMDDRGLWIEMDITYQGLASLTLETKLNLMKLKKTGEQVLTPSREMRADVPKSNSAMFDSDLDDSPESSDEGSDALKKSSSEEEVASPPSGGTGKKILRMVNRIAASRYFQQATEYKYIKRAMEEVSNTRLLLSVELRGLTGTLVLNIPPPPSDRLWYGFRGNPQIWLSARPKLGERRVNIAHVITYIEKKLIQEIQKKFVIPNMDDLVIPVMTTVLPNQFPHQKAKH